MLLSHSRKTQCYLVVNIEPLTWHYLSCHAGINTWLEPESVLYFPKLTRLIIGCYAFNGSPNSGMVHSSLLVCELVIKSQTKCQVLCFIIQLTSVRGGEGGGPDWQWIYINKQAVCQFLKRLDCSYSSCCLATVLGLLFNTLIIRSNYSWPVKSANVNLMLHFWSCCISDASPVLKPLRLFLCETLALTNGH